MTPRSPYPKRVLVLGATGTAGRAALRALAEAGHHVVALVRAEADVAGLHPGAVLRFGRVSDAAVLRDTMSEGRFDAVVSCLGSRSGLAGEAWEIDYKANALALAASEVAGVRHMVFVSAICVQRPKLAFQEAKLAFEEELKASKLAWSIVRPTAFFKSLSGQIARVQAGKPFLMFGTGALTACKPISDRDLGQFIATCLDDPARRNAVLPIGGPGPAITPREQGEMLFALLGKAPKFRRMPLWAFDLILSGLSLGAKLRPALANKAELARIGRYYGTESMLVWDERSGRYDAEATPETGRDRLEDHYREVLAGRVSVDLKDHSVF